MRKHALVVGINEYENVSGLSFCVADARAMAAELSKQNAEVTTLLDGEATKEGILGALRAFAQEVEAGDRVVFYYSGHGAGYYPPEDSHPDVSGPVSSSEPSTDGEDVADMGFDEFLCPTDTILGPGGAQSMIRDDELRETLASISAKGAEVVMIADCCHSGTATMGLNPVGTPRRIPPDEMKVLFEGYEPKARGEEVFDLHNPVPNQLLIAGCQDTQLSWESASIRHGYMTHFMLEALRNGEAATYQELFNRIAPRVADEVMQENEVNQDMNLVDGFGRPVPI